MSTIQLDDGQLWYEDRGTGPPLVFLHGGWQRSESWAPQVEQFTDDYRVITADFRGHGQTGATDSRRYSIDLFVDDLEQLLSELDIENPILAGLSLGGMVVQAYLDRHPDGARGAVIGGPLQSMPPFDFPASVKPFVSPVPAIAGMASTMGPRATFQSLLTGIRAITGRRWLTIDEGVRSQTMDAIGVVTPKEYPKIFRALYEFEPPTLSDIETPLLVLYGDHEAPMVKQQGHRLAGTVPVGAIREISNAGHLVNQDAPGAFNAACKQFFGTLKQPVLA